MKLKNMHKYSVLISLIFLISLVILQVKIDVFNLTILENTSGLLQNTFPLSDTDEAAWLLKIHQKDPGFIYWDNYPTGREDHWSNAVLAPLKFLAAALDLGPFFLSGILLIITIFLSASFWKTLGSQKTALILLAYCSFPNIWNLYRISIDHHGLTFSCFLLFLLSWYTKKPLLGGIALALGIWVSPLTFVPITGLYFGIAVLTSYKTIAPLFLYCAGACLLFTVLQYGNFVPQRLEVISILYIPPLLGCWLWLSKGTISYKVFSAFLLISPISWLIFQPPNSIFIFDSFLSRLLHTFPDHSNSDLLPLAIIAFLLAQLANFKDKSQVIAPLILFLLAVFMFRWIQFAYIATIIPLIVLLPQRKFLLGSLLIVITFGLIQITQKMNIEAKFGRYPVYAGSIQKQQVSEIIAIDSLEKSIKPTLVTLPLDAPFYVYYIPNSNSYTSIFWESLNRNKRLSELFGSENVEDLLKEMDMNNINYLIIRQDADPAHGITVGINSLLYAKEGILGLVPNHKLAYFQILKNPDKWFDLVGSAGDTLVLRRKQNP